ncbi:chymotrypsin-1-like [Teleopsis dalmanni]|uniref:chymotrypsin-1-like n=1 Tax=Teleopsis dalmanni TaxID=139649 RepID=UPI0018CD5E80|nr:chymotrypsin-1-like [Teleopsis dalmanni]
MKVLKIIFAILLSAGLAQAIKRAEPSAELLAKLKTKNIDINGRVVGGEQAEEGFAPYQISIQGEWDGHMCGGSIIADKWIITAAHCVYGYNQRYLRIITGTNKWREPGKIYFLDEYFVHCNYGYPDYANDIALVRLNDSIVMNEFTQPIPLADVPLEDGADVILTGWGSTGVIDPNNLQKITLKYMEHNRCLEAFDYDEKLDVGHMCTFTREGEGACYGDSGGPLVSDGKLVALVNWGYPCALGMPDAHASIHYYLDWIRRTMSGCPTCHCVTYDYPFKF